VNIRNVFVLWLAISLTACSSVHIHRLDGSVDVSQGFGVVNIVTPENMPLVVNVDGVGVHLLSDSFFLGYSRVSAAYLDESCRVVFWIDSTEQAKNIATLLSDIKDSCFINITKE